MGQVMFCATPLSDSVAALRRASSSVALLLRTRNASRVKSGTLSMHSPQSNGPPSARQALMRLSKAAAGERGLGALVEGGGARRVVAAEANASNRDAHGVEVAPRLDEVDHSLH